MEFKDAENPSGPVAVGNGLTIEVNRDACIGCGGCTAVAPETFGIDDEGKSVILASADSETAESVLDAANSCPVGAISTKE